MSIIEIPESLSAFLRAGVVGIVSMPKVEEKHKRTVRILVPESEWEPRHDESNNNGGKVLFVKVSDDLHEEMEKAYMRHLKERCPHIFASIIRGGG